MKNYFSYLLALFFLTISNLNAQIPKPSETFGFEVGTDYKLADYDQMLTYYEKLAASTNRVQMIDIGKSVMGRPIKLLFISRFISSNYSGFEMESPSISNDYKLGTDEVVSGLTISS